MQDITITEEKCGYYCVACGVDLLGLHSASCQETSLCNTCGKSAETDGIVIGYISHSSTPDTVESDDYKHWYICKDCHEEQDAEFHFDTNSDGKCDYCDHEIATMRSSPCTEHRWKVESNDWNHYLVCEICGEEDFWQTHGSCDPEATECAVCRKPRAACGEWSEGHLADYLNGGFSNETECSYTCAVCGELAESHYHEADCAAPETCIYCGKTAADGGIVIHWVAPHYANCTDPETCAHCGKTVADDGIEIDSVTHFGEFDHFDGHCHWRVCTECGEVCDKEWHEDWDGEGICWLCGAEIAPCPGHQWEVFTDAWSHCKRCAICGEIEGTWWIHGSCDLDATACAGCGMPREECKAWTTGHVYDPLSDLIITDDRCGHACATCGVRMLDYHIAPCSDPDVCADCGKSASQDGIRIRISHTHGEQTIEKTTYTHIVTYQCEDCGKTITEEGHHFDDGPEEGVCWFCGAELVPCTGHQFGQEFSGWADGHYDYCSVCGTARSKTAEPHVDEDWNGVCDLCGYSFREAHVCSEYVEKVDAKYLKTAATCTAPAVYYKSCPVCGKAGTATFTSGAKDTTNHVGGTKVVGQKDATCTEVGYTGDTVCLGCQAVVTQGQEIPAASHIPGKWIVDTTPEIGVAGTAHKACTVCGVTLETKVTPALEAPPVIPELPKEPEKVEEVTPAIADAKKTEEVLNTDMIVLLMDISEDGEVPETVEETKPGALKEALERGETIVPEVKSEVKEVTELPQEEAKQVEAITEELQAENVEVAMVLDLSVALVNESGETLANMRELGQPIEFAVAIPADQAAALAGKEVVIIRIHNGAAEALPATLEGNVLRFKTDKFSDYIVASYDKPSTGDEEGEKEPKKEDDTEKKDGGKKSSNPDTGDRADWVLWMSLMLASALALAWMALRKRIREN